MNPLTDLERRITARQNSTNSVAAHDAYGMVLQDLVAVQAAHTANGGGTLDELKAWLQERVAACNKDRSDAESKRERHEWDGLILAYMATLGKILLMRATYPARPDESPRIAALTAQLDACHAASKGNSLAETKAQAELRKADGERIAALTRTVALMATQHDATATALQEVRSRYAASGQALDEARAATTAYGRTAVNLHERIRELTRRIVEMEVRLGEHEWDARTDPVMPAPVPNWQPFCEAQADTMTERIFGEYATRATPDDADHGVQDAPDATADRSHLIVRLHINPHTGKPGKSYVDANDVRRVVADALAERDAAMPDA